MKELSTSLLREKFIIHDPRADLGDRKGPVVALSNRIALELRDDRDRLVETIVIRAQNMHACTRMTAKILQSFISNGSLLERHSAYDWDSAWNSLVNDYEAAYNPQRWVAIYNKGRLIFESGARHPLLDVIEKCAARNKGPYDDSIPMAEDAFKEAGKVIKLEYDGNVALIVNLEQPKGRCGIILRGADKTTTFNFSAEAKAGALLNYPQILSGAAAFLEGIQLAFMVGMNEEKIKLGRIALKSPEEKQTREARRRLGRLSAELANLESVCEIRYRPEKPVFAEIILEAEALAKKLFEPPPGKHPPAKK